ncbi:sigma-54 interaction domain-containing protein [Alkaliphilus transvaalensis]|uniref:sigma-54 interaction domain-containing protein n=1 Tax=Alkaliphilus transvaalensis TaxID=114628 RepID=UPI000A018FC0|nr:sigma 54-interacting transcriptional regulator [Alkaliphilus transvaalensis]
MNNKSKKLKYRDLNLIEKIDFDSEERRNDAEFLLNLYKDIFNITYNWLVVVDEEGYIIMINKRYCDFLGVDQEEAIGSHVTDIIDNTRMHIVVKTGQKEIGDIQEIKGNQMIADRIPIFRNGKLIGGLGTVIFKNLVEFDVYVKNILKMEKELEFYKKELKKALGGNYNFDNIVGSSSSIKQVKELAKKVAASKSNVLLLGESGTGKELFAHAIHNASSRGEYPLIKVNCGAIPSELIESELFGYEHGAFTGAKKGGKPGKFELANNSTIFLDEIGDLPLNMQVKILRVLQEREIERVGGTKSYKVDVRVIAATNKNLQDMMEKNVFREDLYYRLNVISINIPPLRERKEDIALIANHLLKKLAGEMDRHVTEISPAAIQALKNYHWPGNIRELANLIERALNLVEKEAMITLEHLPYYIRKSIEVITGSSKMLPLEGNENTTLKEIVEEVERKTISQALQETGGNKYQTSIKLGISRTSLYEKIKKYGLEMLIK